jgi:hypothetical protein
VVGVFTGRFLVGLREFVWEILKTYPRPHNRTSSSHDPQISAPPRTLHLTTKNSPLKTHAEYPAPPPRTLHLTTKISVNSRRVPCTLRTLHLAYPAPCVPCTLHTLHLAYPAPCVPCLRTLHLAYPAPPPRTLYLITKI